MKPSILIVLLIVSLSSCKESRENNSDEQQTVAQEEMGTKVVDSNALSNSPRHHEWVDFKRQNGSTMKAFVVYPETNLPAKSVIAIHENRGLNDWAREFADELASHGYLVIAPDLISNTVEGIEKTTDFSDSDKAREAIYALDPEMVTEDLDAVYQYLKNDNASNGQVAVVGFCWGGSQTFRYATNNPDISQAIVFYGTAPDDANALARIKAPVYGFYGENDNRVNATIPQTESKMKDAGKTYEYKIYEGAGHAFMRSGHHPDADATSRKIHDEAWARLLTILENE